MREAIQVVVYRDSGGGVQVWCGPEKDWLDHSREYAICEADIEEQFAFVGRCVMSADLSFYDDNLCEFCETDEAGGECGECGANVCETCCGSTCCDGGNS